ncbi:MAG: lipopolysaccharide biosynthesis protein [Clostridium sp.]|jgi:O-antigen/teichoic acid export membrane protein|nr:lipopolysaccharide biosynthesis protein [Clostridium sp.]
MVIRVEAKSRAEYSARNTTIAVTSNTAAILMGYAVRVVFTHTLSESYVGVSGLFTDILNILNLSEMGIGAAVTYALYLPVARGDREKQKSLMRLFRLFYRLTAAAVALLGLAVVPFLGILTGNPPEVKQLTLIYLMYLTNTSISYLFTYKRTVVDAHQLIYIGTLYQTVFLILQDVVQIGILLLTRDFLLFLSVYLVCTLGANLGISRKADKLYPYLKEKNRLPLPQEEKRDIYRNIRAMLLHKLGHVAVNNTDHILLSVMAGISTVGIYSNYFLLVASVAQVLDKIFQGITASVGNLGVTENAKRVRRIFDASCFIGQWMYGLGAICLFECLNPFVEISFGASYLFPEEVVLLLCLNFWITGMRRAVLVFRDSLGLFWFDRYKSVLEALLNLAVSIALGFRLGVLGIFLGTAVSTLLTSSWVEPYMLYKHHLDGKGAKASGVRSLGLYFLRYVYSGAVLAGVWFLTDFLCRMVQGSPVMVLLFRVAVCAAAPNLLLFLAYRRNKEFLFLTEKAAKLLKSRDKTSLRKPL